MERNRCAALIKLAVRVKKKKTGSKFYLFLFIVAAMGAILAALQPFESVKFSFSIFISAFPARALDYKDYFLPNKQKLPSMHIIGLKDLLVDPER